jgi:ABC-type glycerol-3-phosphate transport system substrate-binding protein
VARFAVRPLSLDLVAPLANASPNLRPLPSRREVLRIAASAALGLLAAGGCATRRPVGTIEFWTWALRPWFDELMLAMIADFEQKTPGARVVWSDVATDAMRRKCFAAGAAGAMPDVINFSDQHFAQFAGLGALTPLTDVLPDDPQKRYIEGALAANVIDGRLVGLPWYLSTPVRTMNTRLLRDGGLSPETVGGDWQTLLAQAAPYRKKTDAFLFTLPLGNRSDLPAMMLADGIELFADDGSPRLRESEVISFVKTWASAFAADVLPRSSATGGYQAMLDGLAEQRVALINANAVAHIKKSAPTVLDSLAVAPAVVGKLNQPSVAVTHVAVTEQSQQKELAATFAWHVTSPHWQKELAVAAGRVPSTIASLTDAAFTTATAGDLTAEATVISTRQLPNARTFKPPLGVWPEMRLAFDDAMKRILIDKQDVADALAEADKQWRRLLGRDATEAGR